MLLLMGSWKGEELGELPALAAALGADQGIAEECVDRRPEDTSLVVQKGYLQTISHSPLFMSYPSKLLFDALDAKFRFALLPW